MTFANFAANVHKRTDAFLIRHHYQARLWCMLD